MFISDESKKLAVDDLQTLIDACIRFGGDYIDKHINIIKPIKTILYKMSLDDYYDVIIDAVTGKPVIMTIEDILKLSADNIEAKKKADMEERTAKALSKFDSTCLVCHSGIAKACGYDFSTGLPKFAICTNCKSKIQFIKDESKLGFHTENVEIRIPTD